MGLSRASYSRKLVLSFATALSRPGVVPTPTLQSPERSARAPTPTASSRGGATRTRTPPRRGRGCESLHGIKAVARSTPESLARRRSVCETLTKTTRRSWRHSLDGTASTTVPRCRANQRRGHVDQPETRGWRRARPVGRPSSPEKNRDSMLAPPQSCDNETYFAVSPLNRTVPPTMSAC